MKTHLATFSDAERVGEAGVYVYASAARMAEVAASLCARAIASAIKASGSANVLLAGGSTPAQTYNLLSQPPRSFCVPWENVHFFWGDERCVPPDHPDSNFLLASKSLLTQLEVPQEHIHRIRGELPAEQAADEYDRELRNHFGDRGHALPRFDLVLLGIGNDGHTASLFPNDPALYERDRLAVVTRKEGVWHRVSLTLPVINSAANVVFLATGDAKAEAVRRALHEETPEIPASLVAPAGDLYWLLDSGAGSRLLEHGA